MSLLSTDGEFDKFRGFLAAKGFHVRSSSDASVSSTTTDDDSRSASAN
jgi:hypothetical protein